MDAVALQILHQGLLRDAEVVAQAASRARQRLAEAHPGSLEACGYELHRLYNILEKAFERVCEAFENNFEKRGDYHEKLLERMTLHLPDIRPPFIPTAARPPLRELKSFRHILRHAYDFELRGERLGELAEIAAQVAGDFPKWIEAFVQQAAKKIAD